MKKNTVPFVKTIIAIAIAGIVLWSASGCSKENKKPHFNYEEQRIGSITDRSNNETATFTYDEQKGLSRIDYNYDGNTSLRFEYTLPTITAQYYKGAAPDITREKYVFTTLNGNTVNIRMTKPDGTVYDTYLDYDANGRMTEVGVRGISSGGANLIFSMDCYFSYPQSNTQQVKLYGARGFATDSLEFVRTYDPLFRYFDFTNIGFNYFGSFSTGIAYKLSGLSDVIAPFPFFTSRPSVNPFDARSGITPATYPLSALKGEGKARNLSEIPPNNGWKPVTWNNQFGNGYYRYDEMGRLTEEGGRYQFTWQ